METKKNSRGGRKGLSRSKDLCLGEGAFVGFSAFSIFIFFYFTSFIEYPFPQLFHLRAFNLNLNNFKMASVIFFQQLIILLLFFNKNYKIFL